MWNSIKALFSNGSQALNLAAIFNAGLFCICLALSFADERSVAGVNPWLKPMKFCLSIVAYSLTLSIILGLVDGFEKMRLWIGRLVAGLMYVEIFCIAFQAARGVPSHYNITTELDGAIFGVMGVLIAINTVLATAAFGLMVMTPVEDLGTGVLWGIRFGLVMLIAASFEGSMMIMNQAHTIGAPDGTPGIQWLNWSKTHGDLRVAHFIGLHALQILPLFGLLVDAIVKQNALRAALVTAATAALAWLMWMQTGLANAGKPFFML